MAMRHIAWPLWDTVPSSDQELTGILIIVLIIHYTSNEQWGLEPFHLSGDIPAIVIRDLVHKDFMSS